MNGWTLPSGDLDPSLFFRDSLHFIEEGNVQLTNLIITFMALTKHICFLSKLVKGIDVVVLVKLKLQFFFLVLH